MMDTDSWGLLTDPTSSSYHSWWAPTLLFELFFNTTAFVFCILLIALFFAKRAAWPRVFVTFIVIGIIGSALDLFFIHQIPAATESGGTSIRSLIGGVIGALIWIPYAFRSKRVKATFRY